jgi:serine/threonine-protein kinase
VIGATIYVVANRTPSLLVPNVKNFEQSAATQLLQARGFKVDPQLQNNDSVPAGMVIRQSPASASHAPKGSTVTIYVSLGAALFPVPEVRSMPFNTAQKTLVEAGFTVKRVDQPSDTVKKGLVIGTDPSPRVPIEKGTLVTVTVSSGPQKFAVPDLVGSPQDTAKTTLQNDGFNVVVKLQTDPKVAKDAVISLDPKPGTMLPKGATVTLTVSTGPPPVKVPNLQCMTRAQAQDALTHAGLKANFQGLTGSNKKVVDQNPIAGTDAPKGSTVDVVMGYGSTC